MIDKLTLGRRIKERRISLGLTQGQLGELIDAHWNRISNWEIGYTSPPINYLCRIATAMNCSVDYLVGLDEHILNADELSCLEAYRTLSDEDKELIRTILAARSRPTPEE